MGSFFGGGNSAQVKAAKEANRIAREQAQQAEREMNKANAKEPDIDSIKSENSNVSSTLLTGAGGVDLLDNQKKKKTLLGEA